MAVPKSHFLVTETEYLERERAAQERHEYLDGYVYAMAGESPEHGEICVNLAGILHPQLRGTPCRARIANSKIRSGPSAAFARNRKGMFSYPDLFVICGELEFYDEQRDVILNPTVIFEVLSNSTESFDRGEKFLRYQIWNPSLQDYVLISQTSPTVEHFSRQSDGSWTYRVFQGVSASFAIKSIKCTFKLADIYERVTFPPEEQTDPAPKKKSVKAAKTKSVTQSRRKK